MGRSWLITMLKLLCGTSGISKYLLTSTGGNRFEMSLFRLDFKSLPVQLSCKGVKKIFFINNGARRGSELFVHGSGRETRQYNWRLRFF